MQAKGGAGVADGEIQGGTILVDRGYWRRPSTCWTPICLELEESEMRNGTALHAAMALCARSATG